MVLVVWHGHACVELRRSDGYTIVFDPHDGISLGLKRPNVKADLILVTHEHFDHNAVDVVSKPSSKVLRMEVGSRVIGDIKIWGFKSYHDKVKGAERGLNTIYVVEVEGQKIAHLGDLGDRPEPDVMNSLRRLNLLIIPVGGTFTIDAKEAWELIEELKPRNVLPIHYKVPGIRLPLAPVDDFLRLVKDYNVVRLDGNSFELDKYENSVIVPRPP
jgi:L-ascorbate metabolism protein UlaG (beta-lactamase superfamily)